MLPIAFDTGDDNIREAPNRPRRKSSLLLSSKWPPTQMVKPSSTRSRWREATTCFWHKLIVLTDTEIERHRI